MLPEKKTKNSKLLRNLEINVIYTIIENQNIINLLGNIANQLSKFRTKCLVEINDARRTSNTNSQFNLKMQC